MARVAQRHDGHAVLRAFFDAQLRGLLADCLAQAVAAVDHGDHVVLKIDANVLVSQHAAVFQPGDVRGNADHAVRVVPHQVGFGQIAAHPLRFGVVAAGRGEDGAGNPGELVVVDLHEMVSSSMRTNFCRVWQSLGTQPRLPPADIITSPTYMSPKRSIATSCGAKSRPRHTDYRRRRCGPATGPAHRKCSAARRSSPAAAPGPETSPRESPTRPQTRCQAVSIVTWHGRARSVHSSMNRPSGVKRCKRQFSRSATHTTLSASTAMPCGR